MLDLLFGGYATLLARSRASTICGMTQSKVASLLQSQDHDTAAIFDWLMRMLSFQGISDAVAEGYMDRHGNVTWAEIEAVARHQSQVRQAPGVLGVHRLPVPQRCPDLRRAGRIRRLPPTPASAPKRAAEPNRVQPVPVHPGHCRWRHRRWIDRQLADHAGSGNLAAARPPWSTRFGTSMGFPTRSSRWRWHHC